MPNTNDLRYVRTETAIRSAFMELVSETPISSITASAVCRRAAISRNAFYLHYPNVATLYATLVGELVEDVYATSLASVMKRVTTGDDETLNADLLTAIAKHEKMLRAFLPSDDGSLAKQLAIRIKESFVEATFHLGSQSETFENRLNCSYVAWAMVGFVSHWILHSKRPLIEARDLFDKLQAGAVQASVNHLMSS